MTMLREVSPVDRYHRRDAPTLAVTGIAGLAQATGVSLRALRYYEACGLIRSQRTRSGARVFTPEQVEIASTVVLLRKLDVGIPEIQPLIDSGRSDAERARDPRRSLERKAEDLTLRLIQVRKALAATSTHGCVAAE
jgi:DNA-binding transcriptional MerR regulator